MQEQYFDPPTAGAEEPKTAVPELNLSLRFGASLRLWKHTSLVREPEQPPNRVGGKGVTEFNRVLTNSI
ncbi:hypothetical protein AMECASPLE_007294 [Ameca splendens]|uniref:Uncharacterized protein n=1 Tax=Ameca splendens TaxID=208324 RepID=A0ABV0ZVX6_9TELE